MILTEVKKFTTILYKQDSVSERDNISKNDYSFKRGANFNKTIKAVQKYLFFISIQLLYI